MDRRDPPPTDEGWYALHDFRRIDWDAWRDVPDRTREQAINEITDYLDDAIAVADAHEGGSALYSVLGHEADILILHLRPTSAHIGALERQFEGTAFAEFTERTDSFVSITEASGYSERARDYFEGDLDENSGLANYIETRLKPTIPDATHVCFYPMTKRRDPGQNWYDLTFEERAEHMEAHGDIGRDYGGKVVQMITGAIALDDWEWGVTLWGDDLTDMKELLYEMRFDPSTSKFAEFGSFSIGRRFPPSDLPAFLSGSPIPTDDEPAGVERGTAVHSAEHPSDGADATRDGDRGRGETDGAAGTEATEASESHGAPDSDVAASVETAVEDNISNRLRTHGIDVREIDIESGYALAVYSTADASELAEEVDGLRGDFEHYDTHLRTNVRADSGQSVVISLWENERAADIAEGFLTDLSGVEKSVRGPFEGGGESGGDGGEGEGEDGGHEEGEGGEESHSHEGTDGTTDAHASSDESDIRAQLADLDVYGGQPHGEDIYALVLYSAAEVDELEAEVEGLAEGFDRYDTHEGTTVYESRTDGPAAVVSLWETADAADTASEYLSDLPAVVARGGNRDGFGTMGMFYTVKPAHRNDFVEKFDTVGEVLADMEGHRETGLLVNVEDENDMFIASQWDSKDDAMDFFRSDAFAETVDWGRDILADRPRHVFLA